MNRSSILLNVLLKVLFKTTILALLLFASTCPAIDLKLTDINGKTYQLQQLKGKWLVLNYWATWCPPCRDELPMLVDYDNEHKNVMVIGINYEPGIEMDDLRKFVDEYFISFPTIVADRKIIKTFGSPTGLPMTVFIDPDGKVVKKYVGMLNEALLNRITKQNQGKN